MAKKEPKHIDQRSKQQDSRQDYNQRSNKKDDTGTTGPRYKKT